MTTQEAIAVMEQYLELAEGDGDTDGISACEMAISALQASVPRVLTERNIREMIGETGLRRTYHIFIEDDQHRCEEWHAFYDDSYGGSLIPNTAKWSDEEGYTDGIIINECDCGYWRCWNARPTAEQMAATPWQEG